MWICVSDSLMVAFLFVIKCHVNLNVADDNDVEICGYVYVCVCVCRRGGVYINDQRKIFCICYFIYLFF